MANTQFVRQVINTMSKGTNRERQRVEHIALSGMGYLHGIELNYKAHIPSKDPKTTERVDLSDDKWICDIVWNTRVLDRFGSDYQAIGYLKLEFVDYTDPAKPVHSSIETGEIRAGEQTKRLTEVAGFKTLRVVGMCVSTGDWFDGFDVDIVPNFVRTKPFKGDICAILRSWGPKTEIQTSLEETRTQIDSFIQSSAKELSGSVSASIEADYFVKAKLAIEVGYKENSSEEARQEHVKGLVEKVNTKYKTDENECLVLVATGNMYKASRPEAKAVFMPTSDAEYFYINADRVHRLENYFDLSNGQKNFPTGWEDTLEAFEEPKTKLTRYRLKGK